MTIDWLLVVAGHRGVRSRSAALFMLCLVAAPAARAQRWTVVPTPVVRLGQADQATGDGFAVVTGATRLPDGNILVGDRADYAMRIFSPTGQEVKKFARKGHGPGEITFSAWTMRCGEQALVFDIEGSRVSVFTLSGTFQRSFRFDEKVPANSPYRSACNRGATFVHYGWEDNKAAKPGLYRSLVPVWTSPADSGPGRMLGKISGSERWVSSGGTRPLPLGKEPRVAMGRERVYVGDATDYTIKVFALNGTALANIHKNVTATAVTPADVSAELEREVSSMGEKWRTSIARDYATMTMPRTLPPFRALVVDSDDNLWVQDYAKSSAGNVRWTVFDSHGKQVSEIDLPSALEVYEIGTDYVLGRYLDPEESVPEVRLYRLSRR